MAYKNTSATPSIQGQYYNWQYFSHGMAKLKGIKPQGVNISYKAPEENYFDNWQSDVMSWLSKGAEVYSNWRTEESVKEAKEYLNTHTLEEYKKDYRTSNIPFQNDPIAMSELKRGHGRLTFQLAKEDWLDRVKQGEFAGKNLSDEEMDVEYFNYVRQKQKEVAESLGYNENDTDFKEGYYELSPSARVEVGTTNRSVTHAWNLQQSILNKKAELTSYLQDANTSPSSAGSRIVDILNSAEFAHFTPEMRDAFLQGAIATYGDRTDIAGPDVQAFGNTKLPNGQTLKEFYGKDNWEALVNKAQINHETANALDFYQFTRDIEDIAEEGSVEELEKRLQDLDKFHDGVLPVNDKQAQVIVKAIARAKDVRDAKLASEAKETQKIAEAQRKSELARQYVLSCVKGGGVIFNPKDVGIDVSEQDIDTAFATEIFNIANTEGLQGVASFLLKGGSNSEIYGYNPFRAYIKKNSESARGSLEGQLQAYLQRTPNDRTVPNAPQFFNTVKEMLQQDSEKAYMILNGVLGKEDLELMSAVSVGEKIGVSWEQIFDGLAQRRAFYDKKLNPDGQEKLRNLDNAINEYLAKLPSGVDNVLKNIIRYKVMGAYASTNNLPMAYSMAWGDVMQNTVELNGTLVPKAFFSGSNIGFDEGLKLTKDFLDDRYPTSIIGGSEYGYVYDYSENALRVIALDGDSPGQVIEKIHYEDNTNRNEKTVVDKARSLAEEQKAKGKEISENRELMKEAGRLYDESPDEVVTSSGTGTGKYYQVEETFGDSETEYPHSRLNDLKDIAHSAQNQLTKLSTLVENAKTYLPDFKDLNEKSKAYLPELDNIVSNAEKVMGTIDESIENLKKSLPDKETFMKKATQYKDSLEELSGEAKAYYSKLSDLSEVPNKVKETFGGFVDELSKMSAYTNSYIKELSSKAPEDEKKGSKEPRKPKDLWVTEWITASDEDSRKAVKELWNNPLMSLEERLATPDTPFAEAKSALDFPVPVNEGSNAGPIMTQDFTYKDAEEFVDRAKALRNPATLLQDFNTATQPVRTDDYPDDTSQTIEEFFEKAGGKMNRAYTAIEQLLDAHLYGDKETDRPDNLYTDKQLQRKIDRDKEFLKAAEYIRDTLRSRPMPKNFRKEYSARLGMLFSSIQDSIDGHKKELKRREAKKAKTKPNKTKQNANKKKSK